MNTQLWEQWQGWKENAHWVDLTHELSPQTPHWVGWPALNVTSACSLGHSLFGADSYTTVGQYGTHVDAPTHMVAGARSLEQVGIEEMVLPLCVIDLSEKVAADADYVVTVADIDAFEAKHGRIPTGAFVAFRSDWSKRPAADMDNLDAEGNRHFPAWSMESLRFLVEERQVGSIGHETSDTESPLTSGETGYAVEKYILSQDRIQIELLCNLDQCPATGALIFCTFPKVKNGTGFPARCFALCPAD